MKRIHKKLEKRQIRRLAPGDIFLRANDSSDSRWMFIGDISQVEDLGTHYLCYNLDGVLEEVGTNKSFVYREYLMWGEEVEFWGNASLLLDELIMFNGDYEP